MVVVEVVGAVVVGVVVVVAAAAAGPEGREDLAFCLRLSLSVREKKTEGERNREEKRENNYRAEKGMGKKTNKRGS